MIASRRQVLLSLLWSTLGACVWARLFRHPRSRDRYGGLLDLVSFSSCLIAAKRAWESWRPDAYISDPLAAGLAGPQAMQARAQTSEPAPPAGQKRPIDRLVMRTLFFDDAVRVATRADGGAGPSTLRCHQQVAEVVSNAACKQVVLLGAGLDSRPWRLELPAGVRWWEVDQDNVLRYKQSRLTALGAQLRGRGSSAAAHPGSSGQQQQQQQQEPRDAKPAQQPASSWQFPLLCESWRCAAVNLCRAGWSKQLLRQGLDPRQPVCWVLEGLLYYFDEAEVQEVLKEVAAVSAPGSVLVASIIVQPEETAQAAPAAPASPAAAAAPAAAASQVPAAAAPAGEPSAEGAQGTVQAPSAGPRGAASSGGEPEGPTSAEAPSKPAGYNLNAQFKWKCKGDPRAFFGGQGWRALECASWSQIAGMYGLPVAEQSKVSSVYYITAALA